MMHNNFKNAISTTIILALSVCLIPESAQAGVVKGSGRSSNNIRVDFNLDDSIIDMSPNDNNFGYFPGAIQDFNFNPQDGYSPSELNLWFCGAEPGELCQNGDLYATRYGNNLQRYTINFKSFETEYPSSNYKGIFAAQELTWYIQSNDSNLVNNLSSLSQFKGKMEGTFEFRLFYPFYERPQGREYEYLDINGYRNAYNPPDDFYNFRVSLTPESVPQPQQVPEPSDTAGFLVVSTALGAVSLLKRHKRLKKLV